MPPRLMVPLPDGSFFVPCAGSKRAAGEENVCWLEALNCFSVGADQRAEFWAAADRRVGYCHAHEYGAAPSASERMPLCSAERSWMLVCGYLPRIVST